MLQMRNVSISGLQLTDNLYHKKLIIMLETVELEYCLWTFHCVTSIPVGCCVWVMERANRPKNSGKQRSRWRWNASCEWANSHRQQAEIDFIGGVCKEGEGSGVILYWKLPFCPRELIADLLWCSNFSYAIRIFFYLECTAVYGSIPFVYRFVWRNW